MFTLDEPVYLCNVPNRCFWNITQLSQPLVTPYPICLKCANEKLANNNILFYLCLTQHPYFTGIMVVNEILKAFKQFKCDHEKCSGSKRCFTSEQCSQPYVYLDLIAYLFQFLDQSTKYDHVRNLCATCVTC